MLAARKETRRNTKHERPRSPERTNQMEVSRERCGYLPAPHGQPLDDHSFAPIRRPRRGDLAWDPCRFGFLDLLARADSLNRPRRAGRPDRSYRESNNLVRNFFSADVILLLRIASLRDARATASTTCSRRKKASGVRTLNGFPARLTSSE